MKLTDDFCKNKCPMFQEVPKTEFETHKQCAVSMKIHRDKLPHPSCPVMIFLGEQGKGE